MLGALNLNLLDYSMDSKVKNYLNIVIQNFYISMLNKTIATLLKKRLWHSCFPGKVAKFLKISFL